MRKQDLLELYFALWHLITKVNHLLMLAREKELKQDGFAIPVRQAYILRVIEDLGPQTTLIELANKAERRIDVISRQTVKMENDGLIKRIKDKPKSNLLRVKLTKKGLAVSKVSRKSKLINAIFSSFSEEELRKLESMLNTILIKLEEHNPL